MIYEQAPFGAFRGCRAPADQYAELLVRTNQLLLHVEESQDQEVSHTGKAIVIASL